MADVRDPKELFGATPIPRLFLTAALPGAVGMLVMSIYDTVDGIMVGNFVGETPFAAINLAMPFVIALFAFGDLIGAGSSVPISIALGENRDDDANNLFTCSCIMTVATGALLGSLFWFLAPTIMRLMGATGDLAAFAVRYLRVYSLFAPFTTINYAFDNYLRISGKIRRSFLVNAYMASFGAALEYVLLAKLGLGVGASAFAYSLAMTTSVLIAALPFLQGKLQLRFVRPRFSMANVFEVFRCGLPTFLDNIAGRAASIVINAVLLTMGGEDAVAIYGLSVFTIGIIVWLIYGTLDAMQPAVGYNWGARDFTRVKWLEVWCFGSTALLSLLYMGCILLVPHFFVRLFLPEAHGALLDEATHALTLMSAALMFRWFCFSAQAFLVNVGEVVPATLMSICTALLFPLLLIVVLSPFGLNGIWLIDLVNAMLTSLMGAFMLLRVRDKIRAMRSEVA